MAELEGKTLCKNGCGATIGFHEKWLNKAKTGKIPVEVLADGKWKAHDCPKKPGKEALSTTINVDMSSIKPELQKIAELLERISGQLAQKTA